MPTKNMSFLAAYLRILLRRYGRELKAPVVILILGAMSALGIANYTETMEILHAISGQERTFDQVIDKLNEQFNFDMPILPPLTHDGVKVLRYA